MSKVNTAAERSAKLALVSKKQVVIVEAPAGCGKTHMASKYAEWLVAQNFRGTMLILTHTHAACDVFRSRVKASGGRISVGTFDSFISQICVAYHRAIGLPADVASWAKSRENGFDELGRRAMALLTSSPAVLRALVQRYPYVLCDEHQDSNAYQNQIVLAMSAAGSVLRIFGDPMQEIYGKGETDRNERRAQWSQLWASAEASVELDHPHRWDSGSTELGDWVLKARELLKKGQTIDLSNFWPSGLEIITCDNISPRFGGFQLEKQAGRLFREKIIARENLMILASQNDLVSGVNSYLGRTVPIWEGHQREALSVLVGSCVNSQNSPEHIGSAFRTFIQSISSGFGDSAFAKRLLTEIKDGAAKPCKGKPYLIQSIAKHIIASPNHIGIARALSEIEALRQSHSEFKAIHIDYRREFWDAIKLANFSDPEQGLAELNRKRSFHNNSMPNKVISTVHKAKGLESDHVVLAAFSQNTFPDTDEKRCLLYVALSRAKHSLTICVSKSNPSPLLKGF